MKTRLLASRESLIRDEQLLLRWDIEEDDPVPDEASNALYEQAIADLEGASALIASDYGQGVITDGGWERLFAAATKAGVPVIADPKLTGLHRTEGGLTLFQLAIELMRDGRLGFDGAEAAENFWHSTIGSIWWFSPVKQALPSIRGTKKPFMLLCGLVDIRQR